MEKRIAVINFNMIMGSVIRLYDRLVDINENPVVSWNIIEDQLRLNILSDLRYDSDVLIKLAEIIGKNLKKKNNGLTLLNNITDHVDLFDEDNEDTYIITNFDFFPCYDEDRDMVEKNKYNIKNWIFYLTMHGKTKISTNTWVKCANSDINPLLIEKGLNCKSLASFKTSDTFDEIIFLFSPLYVPSQYRHLYELIIEMTKYIKRG